ILQEDGSRACRNVAVRTINSAITDLPVISVVTHGFCYLSFVLRSLKPDILRLTRNNEAVMPWLLPKYPTEVCLLSFATKTQVGYIPHVVLPINLVKDLSADASTGQAARQSK
ncbi:hypothetical protein QR685DRAFT_452874, partial [Neurospora intermedia]